jgi:trk system potassium uptake protein TrkH
MRWRYTLYVVGVIIAATGASMLLALAFALYYDEGGIMPLLESMAIAFIVGGLLILFFREKHSKPMTHREGMAVVTLGWLGAGLIGAFPFYLGGVFESYLDCVFESVSGFTTTGASVLANIEAQPRGLLMWRSLTHWLGGMGIIVLALAILPFLGVGGMQLYKSEVPGPTPDKLRPRIKDTAMLLWQVYVLFTVLETVLLMFGGLNLFEALCHTFGTMATGGFSTKNTSIAFYDSAYIQTVITIFMLIAGANFTLHYQLLRGRPLAFWKDPEFKFYIGIFAAFTALSVVSVTGIDYETVGEAIRYCSFQVASILTTTGYVTADYEVWTPLPQVLLLFLMFLGGSAGSTGGGMKCMRILLLMKHAYRELFRLVHPRAVTRVKLGGKSVSPEVMGSIWGFFLLYIGLFIVSSFIMAAMGVDVVTSFASVAACIGNIGPGLGAVGPTDNYAHIPWMGKWLLIFCMLLGRLEIYTVIILFVPEFWRK